jgi:hypothetical protein
VAGSCEYGDEPSGSGAKELVFTDNVEYNCHFLAPGCNCYYIRKLILLLLWSNT